MRLFSTPPLCSKSTDTLASVEVSGFKISVQVGVGFFQKDMTVLPWMAGTLQEHGRGRPIHFLVHLDRIVPSSGVKGVVIERIYLQQYYNDTNNEFFFEAPRAMLGAGGVVLYRLPLLGSLRSPVLSPTAVSVYMCILQYVSQLYSRPRHIVNIRWNQSLSLV